MLGSTCCTRTDRCTAQSTARGHPPYQDGYWGHCGCTPWKGRVLWCFVLHSRVCLQAQPEVHGEVMGNEATVSCHGLTHHIQGIGRYRHLFCQVTRLEMLFSKIGSKFALWFQIWVWILGFVSQIGTGFFQATGLHTHVPTGKWACNSAFTAELLGGSVRRMIHRACHVVRLRTDITIVACHHHYEAQPDLHFDPSSLLPCKVHLKHHSLRCLVINYFHLFNDIFTEYVSVRLYAGV